MSRSLMNAKYTLTHVPNSDLVEIGITPKELIKLTAKMTFYGMLPTILIVGGLIVIGTYMENPKPIVDINDIDPPETD